VALCPTTEANLGDGLFPLRDYLDADGRWGIGSDSHISVSPVEELRWLEYGQRLITRHRNIAASADAPSVGDTLLAGVRASAAPATGFPDPALAEDRIALDPTAPQLLGATDNDRVDRWIFSGNRPAVDRVVVAGRELVTAGRHRDREAVAAGYAAALGRLLKA
jgi:formimidoylglutamate deiminase